MQTQPSRSQSRYQTRQDYFREHRGIAILLFMVVVGLIVGVIIMLYALFNHPDDYGEQTEPEDAPGIYLEHSYLIEYSIGRLPYYQVFWDISAFIISNEQISTAPNPDKTFNEQNMCSVDILETSYNKTNYNLNTVYEVSTNVADGRKYNLNFLMSAGDSSQGYMGMVIDRTDLSSAQDVIVIYTNDPDTDSDTIIEWANTYKLTNPEIITKKSPLPEYPAHAGN